MIAAIVDKMIAFFSKNLQMMVQIILLVLFTWLILYLVGVVARRWKAKIVASKVEGERLSRFLTMENVVITSLRALILAVAALILLGLLGFNIAPLIASAGLAGLAISLGAQTLIKDFISGFLILIENQFGVGDEVKIGIVSGTVENITLRSVNVRGADGSLNIVPNGDIRIVANLSRDWSQAKVEFTLPFNLDLGEVVNSLDQAVKSAENDEAVQNLLLMPAEIFAYNQLNESGVQIRITLKVNAGKGAQVERILRRYVLESLQKQGISLAAPAREILLQEAAASKTILPQVAEVG